MYFTSDSSFKAHYYVTSYMPYYVSHYLADLTQGGLIMLSQYYLEALPKTGPIDLEPLLQKSMSTSKFCPGQCSSVL